MLPNVVLFQGLSEDPTDTDNLWETNGTAAGTFALTPISGEQAYGFAPDPEVSIDLTVFNGQVLFMGRNTTSLSAFWLWTTDGTAAGTGQLTVAGENSAGLFTAATSPDFTVYNGEVLFNGRDNASTPLQSLWTTNGTAPGTQEVTGINGAASTGVNPSDMTVFNGAVLFNGEDTADHLGLWVTNGTGPGTQELNVGPTASATGIDPTDMTVFDGEVLFNGVDANGLSGLWVWNGTTATELVAGAGGASDPHGLDPTDMTVFGNEVLFNGLDASGHQQLWIWNGTTAQQLSNVTGASALEDPSGLGPSDLTVFNGEVLFNGLDKYNNQQLWETNGTVAGTQEVAAPSQGLRPSNMEVYDGEVLFSGYDSSHLQGLWVTNGTALGTFELSPTAMATTPYSIGLFPSDLTAIGGPDLSAGGNASYVAGAPAVTLDSGLSISDLESTTLIGATVSIGADFLAGDVLSVGSPQIGITSSYDAITGMLTLSGSASLAAYQAELDSVTFATTSSTNPSRTIAWLVEDNNDTSATSASSSVSVFVNNSDLDILLQNTSGQLALWQANGATPTLSASGLLGPDPGPNWSEVGVGAFFSGDTSDILWQNTNGTVVVWQMQNDALVSSGVVADPGPNWQVVGAGDFNGDGKTDVLLQNTNGSVAVWDMNGSAISQSGVVADPGPNWHVEGTGDFYNDGKTDIVLQNDNGAVAIWDMNGDQISQSGVVNANPGPAWQIKGTGDFYGDGKTDILWQNDNGTVAIWEMNGDQISKSAVVADPGSAWHVLGTGDFNQDGTTDIVLQSNNGAVAVWDMNGAKISQSAVLANPGPAWSVHS